MIRLQELRERGYERDLPAPGEIRWAEKATVQRVRYAVSEALASPDFLLDCIELELESLADRPFAPGLWPFLVTDDGRIRAAFAYWAPGAEAGPHEHNDWAVTAVVHNRLDVETYDHGLAQSARRLVRKNLFSAERGRVGNICEPCVHNPYNPTAEWSVSLHLFGPNDRDALAVEGEPIPGLSQAVDHAGDPPLEDALARWQGAQFRRRATQVQSEILSLVAAPRAGELLARIEADGVASPLLIDLGTELTRTSPAGDLSVRTHERAELLVGTGDRFAVLLRLDALAEPLLRFVAKASAFRVRDLPGGFHDDDRIAVARALVERGLFLPTSARGACAEGRA